MLFFGAPSAQVVAAFLARQQGLGLAYQPVGATRHGTHPTGFFRDQKRVVLGQGRKVFERARSALRGWAMHHSPVLKLHPKNATLEPGVVVCLQVGWRAVSMLNACQVVYVLNEAQRFGFAYGTLRDHPARGEERFTVAHLHNDDVVLELLAFSRPSGWLFWLGLPVTRVVQGVFSRAYIANMKRAVA